MKKILIAFAAVFLIVGCTPAEEKTVEKNEPIVIGAIGALSGDAASYGQLTQKVSEIRVAEINAAGGIRGRELKLIWEDGKCNPADASRSAQKLVNVDKVSVIFGGTCSGETLGAAPITEKKSVILFSSISSSPEVTDAGDFVFRTYPSDASQGKILGNFAGEKFEKIGMLSEQTDYSVALATVFEENFSGEIVAETFLPTESDFRTRITKLKNENLNALFLNAQSPHKTSIVLKQLAELDWNSPVIGNEMILSDASITAEHANFLEKTHAIGANFLTDTELPKFQEFVKKFEEKFGEPPAYENYTAATLDAIDILAEVLKKIDDPTDTIAIRDELYKIQNHDGFSGKIAFDKNGDVRGAHKLFEFDGEKFVPIADQK
ncbi:ABC transporter substrate-binding protein [bacterium]|jgi:branched-chain amino acid transport system substrate-binding protein|nr:ABC transporter substrate-binding protein [bacterium]MBT6831515.1 ABC transporter substrate-binding protein [bacterium]MBT6996165.1 ABC transporter substrate-binding protein [bacterium]MBT7772548.1 ABC transporter substrate-binding protein [bacterium]